MNIIKYQGTEAMCSLVTGGSLFQITLNIGLKNIVRYAEVFDVI